MAPGDPKSEKIERQVSKSYPKGTKREPKGAKSEPKGSQSEPKGAKRDQNGDQIQHKINIKDKVAKREQKGSPHQDEMDDFWEPFSIKNR